MALSPSIYYYGCFFPRNDCSVKGLLVAMETGLVYGGLHHYIIKHTYHYYVITDSSAN